jgi:hypothetical protein
MNYRQLFQTILPDERIADEPDQLTEYGKDRTKVIQPDPAVIVFPKTTEEVQSIVRLCYERQIPIVPSGGRTGYAGAAVAPDKEVVISFDKMHRLVNIDIESGSVEVESGMILENLQQLVAEQGMMMPLDFAARGSCQIGGCISTNAGGLKVLKYGMTRNLVLGLEVIIKNGEILQLNSNLQKNNAGYDLNQLFIGAEGTLGIITKAILKIVPKPRQLQLALITVNQFNEIIPILREAKLQSLDITAFEFFTKDGLSAVLAHMPSCRNPFDAFYPYYILIEIDGGDNSDRLMNFIETLAEQERITDGTIASGSQQFRDLWGLRENISESISMLGNVHKNDIAVPVSSMSRFIPEFELLVRDHYAQFNVLYFGHIGDGNIHVNVIDPSGMDINQFESMARELDEKMCRLIGLYGGSISAEHGIGLLKKHLLPFQRDLLQIETMKIIKECFDPKGLFNPGKIF